MSGRLSCICFLALVMSAETSLWAEDKPKPQPKVTSVAPLVVSPGSSVTLKIVGLKLDQAASVRVGAAADQPSTEPATQPAATQPDDAVGPTASIKFKAKAPVPTGMDAAKVGDDLLEVELKLPPSFSADELKLVIDTPAGPTPAAELLVKPAETLVDEKEPNNGFHEAQAIHAGNIVRGTIQSAGDVDVYHFEAKKGQRMVAEVIAHRRHSLLDSLLTLYDQRGHVLNQNDDADGPDSLLKFTVPADGAYLLSVTDANNRGGVQFPYLLSLEVAR